MGRSKRTPQEWVTLLRRRGPTLGQGVGAILLGIWPVQAQSFLFLPGHTSLVVGVVVSVASLIWGVVTGARDDESLADQVNGDDDTVVRWAIETASAVMDSMKDDIERWIARQDPGARRQGSPMPQSA